MDKTDETFLELTIEKAVQSVAQGGFPAGAVVVKDGQVIGEGISIGNIIHDPTAHGETASKAQGSTQGAWTAPLKQGRFQSLEPSTASIRQS